jgi:hypothetical protein
MVNEMERLADLGADLYPASGPSPRLRMRALTVPAPRPAWTRPVLVASGVAVLAAGAGAGVVLSSTGGGTPRPPGASGTRLAAFVVHRNADGSVTFTAHDLVDPVAATKALNDAGIAGRVLNEAGAGRVPPDPSCAPGLPQEDLAGLPVFKGGVGTKGADSVTIRSTDYPPGGGMLVIVATQVWKTDGLKSVWVSAVPFKDAAKIPTCVSLE